MFCIYTNNKYKDEEMSLEHIIPLALGESNKFSIFVNRDYNSNFGSKIDGELANDFIIKDKRVKLNILGHSKKVPINTLKGCDSNGDKVLLRVEKDKMIVRDLKSQVEHRVDKPFYKIETKIHLYTRMKFISKVALATGYYLFNEIWQNEMYISELRTVLNSSDEELSKIELKHLRFKDQLMTDEDKLCTAIGKVLMKSFVWVIFTNSSIIFQVNILGENIGAVNIEADIDKYESKYKIPYGTIIICENKNEFHIENTKEYMIKCSRNRYLKG